jgi:hypothetical protein
MNTSVSSGELKGRIYVFRRDSRRDRGIILKLMLRKEDGRV